MDALIWNIRSVNTQLAFERLIKMHRKNNYEFIGLMEPMQQARTLERYRNIIGFAQAISNVSNKIWVFIDEVFEVTVIYNRVQQLTLRLYHTDSHVEIVLTLVYAKCNAIERIELWDSLYTMESDMNVPWLVGGDFNVIWDEEEKFGGLPIHINEIDDFRHCINTCNLFDLGFKGSIFIWWNDRAEEDCIFKRLDRCVANSEFQQTFPGIDVEHASFKEVVKENWKANFSANPYIIFNHKLKKVKKALSVRSNGTFGDIFLKIANLEEVSLVHEAEFEANPTKLNRQRLQKVQAELIKLLALEEKYWKQKAEISWFKDGDRNTKFFYAKVRGRRKKLQLNRIQNNQGVWIEEDEEIVAEAIKFFEDQFSENTIPTSFHIIDNVPALIDMGQNEDLIKQPTMEEVKAAVFGLNGDSVGGPDGFTVISRVIHERLVGLLPTLISKEQSGFVKGRSIVENILLTQEIVTDMRLRIKVGPNVIMKLDTTKVYDRLSWLFLTKVLRKMGFSERFIGMMFAAEALSRGLNALHLNLYFCGYGLPKWSPKINHLAYADDTIIFSSSDATSLRLIMEVLATYESAFWLLVNKAKSAVYLYHLTDAEVADKVERVTGIKSSVTGTNGHLASWATLCMPQDEGGLGSGLFMMWQKLSFANCGGIIEPSLVFGVLSLAKSTAKS
ncbi:uncharacterized protein LOC142181905 [Nicotiana tabacum]|uniref:Uncharacterized protein LOC142181905 n=1 Tax=Nicotiana tabacum TaxID=4097 RepID=A0AC58UQA5_TOBAC